MKLYVYLLAIVVVFAVGFFTVRSVVRAKQEKRVQAILQSERAKAMAKPQEDQQNNVDLFTLKPGDTALVHACGKSFFVQGEGIKDVKVGAAVPRQYATLAPPNAGQFEIAFSCDAIKNKVNIFPLLFTTAQGKEVTIYFMPLSDLDGSLHFHSHFEVRL